MQASVSVKIGAGLDSSFGSSFNRANSSISGLSSKIEGLKTQSLKVQGLKKLRETSKSLGETWLESKKKLQGLEDAMAQSEKVTKAQKVAFSRLGREHEKNTRNYEKAKLSLSGLSSELKEAGINVRNLAREEKRLGLELERNNKLQRAFDSGDRYKNKGNELKSEGVSNVLGGGGILAGLAFPLKEAVEFEASMSKVQALTGLTKGEDAFKALTKEARELGKTTQFSASEAADAMSFLGMAGMKTNAILEATPAVLNLAAASKMGLAETADIASNILSGFGMEAKEMGRAADILAAASTNANVDVRMLGETMAEAAPGAKTAGSSLGEVAAMAGILGDAGIQASKAGTALKGVFNRLAAPTGGAAEKLASLGVSVKDAQGNLRSMPLMLKELSLAMDEMGSADKMAAIKEIFGEEAGGSATILMNKAAESFKMDESMAKALKGSLLSSADELKGMGIKLDLKAIHEGDFEGSLKSIGEAFKDLNPEERQKELTKLFGSDAGTIEAGIKLAGGENLSTLDAFILRLKGVDGVSQKLADTMNDNALGALKRLNSSVSDMGISLGNALLPTLSELATDLSGVVSWISSFAEESPKLTKTILLGVAALGVFKIGLGATQLIGGSFLSFLGILRKGLGLLSFSMSKLTITLGMTKIKMIIASIGTKALAFSTNMLTIAQKGLNLAMRMNPIGLVITAVIGLATVAYTLYKNWEPARKFFDDTWEALKEGASWCWDLYKKLFAWSPMGLIIKNWKPILSFFGKVKGLFNNFFGGDSKEIKGTLSKSENINQKITTETNAPTKKTVPLVRPKKSMQVKQEQKNVFNITVNASEGMDERKLASVAVDKIENILKRKQNANLYDDLGDDYVYG